MSELPIRSIVTVTLNPTMDRVIEVPGFHVGGHQKGRCQSLLPAGKAVNVSRALAASGVRSTAIGWVGRETANTFAALAEQVGFASEFTPIDGPTRENITIIDPASGEDTHIRDVGPTVNDGDIQALSTVLRAHCRPGALIVFTGSAAPGLGDEAFGDLIDLCIRRGAAVAVDSSGAPLRQAARRKLWLIKPNLAELAELTGRVVAEEPDIVAAGRRLAEDIAMVLITAGDRGAYCFADQAVWHGRVTVEANRIRSTVGCGDALLAGFLAQRVGENGAVNDALRYAVAVAGASTMNEEPAFFEPNDVDVLKAATVVRRLV